MSALWGTQTQRTRVLFVSAALVVSLTACEYSGPAEGAAGSSTQSATAQPRPYEENIDEVACLLEVSGTEPGMPSAADPIGELSTVLAPGDYVVKAACAGVHGAKLTIMHGGGMPEASSYACDSPMERFFRHTGGPVTITAVPATGRPAAAGVTLAPNSDPRASELEDMSDWVSQQLKPALPGEVAGYTSSNSATGYGMTAKPGNYELHFLCEGPAGVELSVASWAGAAVLEPVRVECDGGMFTAQVTLDTEGADFAMAPGGEADGRYAFRLVPSA